MLGTFTVAAFGDAAEVSSALFASLIGGRDESVEDGKPLPSEYHKLDEQVCDHETDHLALVPSPPSKQSSVSCPNIVDPTSTCVPQASIQSNNQKSIENLQPSIATHETKGGG